MSTFHLTASRHHVKVSAQVDSADAARELAASFPKSLRMKGGSLSTYRGTPGQDDYERYEAGSVTLDVDLRSNGTTGELNETGIKRVRSFLRNADKAGHVVSFGPAREEHRAHYTGPTSRDELDALLS